MADVLEVLMIGPEGSGKTLLLKQVQAVHEKGRCLGAGELPSHIPTIGVNVVDLRPNPMAKMSLTRQVCLRELGGALGPMWADYYSSERTPPHGMVYTIDSSNPFQVSTAAILLKEALMATVCPFVVCFTKADISVSAPVTLVHLKSLLLYDTIERNYRSRLRTIDSCSSINGTGVLELLEWIHSLD